MKKYLVFLLATLITVGCTNSQKDINKRIVTVTIEPLRYFTEQIAGDKFTVKTIIPSGNNPETYEPTTKQMIDFSRSDIYIKVGDLGFERTWMKKLTNNAPHIIVVNASDGISLLNSKNGIPDPHTWTSPANVKKICANIYHSLRDLDEKDSLYFYKRLEELDKKIDAVDFAIRNNISQLKDRSFLIYHPTLTYFANEYKLNQIPIEEDGKEPSASQILNIINKAKTNNIRIMFVQKEFKSRNTDVISNSTNTKIVEINPLSYDWCKEMTSISEKLK
jgi:zinc transport system substrate-binding protein